MEKANIKIGDELKLTVQRFGKDGDPIMVHKNLIIFLKNTKGGIQIGKLFKVKITKVFPKYAFAEKING